MSGVTAKRREWLFLLAATLVVCTGILPAASAVTGRAQDTTTISVDTSDFAVAISTGGRHLTTLGGPVAPFTYWTTSNVEHRATRVLSKKQTGSTTTYTVATTEQGRHMSVSIRQLPTGVRITYAVDAPPTITAVGIAMTASPAAHYLGSGQRVSSVDMRRTVQPLKASSDCQSSSPSPFFVSTSGLGAWASTWAVGRMAFPGATDDPNACSLEAPVCPVGPPANAVRFCFKTAKATMTVARGSLEQLVIAHAKATGLPRAPWLPQLALIKWRDRIAGPAELFDDIKQLRARNIPIGWVLLDNPWEQGASHSACYGSLTFDTTAYPDPKAMIARIHAEGVRFMLWISPQINRTPPCPAPNYPDGWLSGDDQTFVWDLTLPAARDSYISHLKALVDLGVDGFKGDRGDEVNLEPDRLAGGPGTVFQNLYPLLYDRATAAGLEARHGKNFATMSRSVVPGSSSVLPGFVGPDAEQSFNGLEAEISAGQTAGIAGAPVWGSDVGGYAGGGPLTANVFVRWAQFEALAPIFEVGGAGPNATFWRLGAAAVNGLRDAATLHYELVPYLYALAQSAGKTGLPVIRPLGLEWPNDERAWANDLEFTVGDSLLAAPVTHAGARSRVYLPAGRWIDLFSGKNVGGSRTVTRHNGADDFPLYVRAGSAVPFSFRTPRIWKADWGINDLLRAGRQGWLVAPAAGVAVRSIPDRGATLTARTETNGRVDVTIAHALREEQILLYPQRPVCQITVAGSAAPRVGLARLPSVATGWAVRQGAVVLKVSGAPRTLGATLSPCSSR